MNTDQKSKGIDEYIAGFPPDVQEILERIRMTIRQAAPDAEETINMNMKKWKENGGFIEEQGPYGKSETLEMARNMGLGSGIAKRTILNMKLLL